MTGGQVGNPKAEIKVCDVYGWGQRAQEDYSLNKRYSRKVFYFFSCSIKSISSDMKMWDMCVLLFTESVTISR